MNSLLIIASLSGIAFSDQGKMGLTIVNSLIASKFSVIQNNKIVNGLTTIGEGVLKAANKVIDLKKYQLYICVGMLGYALYNCIPKGTYKKMAQLQNPALI